MFTSHKKACFMSQADLIVQELSVHLTVCCPAGWPLLASISLWIKKKTTMSNSQRVAEKMKNKCAECLAHRMHNKLLLLSVFLDIALAPTAWTQSWVYSKSLKKYRCLGFSHIFQVCIFLLNQQTFEQFLFHVRLFKGVNQSEKLSSTHYMLWLSPLTCLPS